MREVKKDKKRDFIGEKKKEALAAKKAKEAELAKLSPAKKRKVCFTFNSEI